MTPDPENPTMVLQLTIEHHWPGVGEPERSPKEYCSACEVAYCLGMMTIDMQRMSREEKLKVMHALWEDLAREEDAIESPAWHGDALRETEERVRSGSEGVRDWDEAKSELRKRAG